VAEIISKRTIPFPAPTVFGIARQVTRFPEVIPNLDQVTIDEDLGAGRVVSSWEAEFSVGPLKKQVKWTERDHWDEQALTCTFELVEGDMKEYSGSWTFTPNGDGCDVVLTVQFVLGINMLGPMIDKIVNQLMQQNCDELLEGLEKLAAAE